MTNGEPKQRVVQTPCEWCGVAIEHPRRGGRRRSYCTDGHRQRAYEARVAKRKYDIDVAAGRITEPAERVVEVAVETPVPRTVAAWVRMLGELEEQVERRQISWVDHRQIRSAMGRVQGALDRTRRGR